MRRFCALVIAFVILCTSVFAEAFSFDVVEDLGNGTSVITFDHYDYYVASNADIATGDLSNSVLESIAWTPRDDKKEDIKNEVDNSPSPSVSNLTPRSTRVDITSVEDSIITLTDSGLFS